eukprot:12924771-Prorocentrum_lima.AAC.1
MPATRRDPRLCFLLGLCLAYFPMFEFFHNKRVVPMAAGARWRRKENAGKSQQERPEHGERRFD